MRDWIWMSLVAVIPLYADLPGEVLITPPESVSIRVRKDAIGVWMMPCPPVVSPPGPYPPGSYQTIAETLSIPVFQPRGDTFVSAGRFPVDSIRTITLFGFGVRPYCIDFTTFRIVVTGRQGGWMEVVLDVVRDRRVWVPVPPDIEDPFSEGGNWPGYVVWLNALVGDTARRRWEYVIPGFFDRRPVAYQAPRWDAPVIPFLLGRGDFWRGLVPSLLLVPEGQKGDFIRVSRVYIVLGETAPLRRVVRKGDRERSVWIHYGEYGFEPYYFRDTVFAFDKASGKIKPVGLLGRDFSWDRDTTPEAVWVPIRDQEGALLIWFGYVTD